ncbi:hypothetical protein BMF94_1311 [Rhodotorula taiwanensis]|uniref:Uncharacterized protein n=1 Tax=Rhodotorula taiwanensis TaxID=741276 RepID=A0A2S5BFZ3_9BASI|nr:hypothetical protein BMF94_1311 [Rhodotorula taiwanensis]
MGHPSGRAVTLTRASPPPAVGTRHGRTRRTSFRGHSGIAFRESRNLTVLRFPVLLLAVCTRASLICRTDRANKPGMNSNYSGAGGPSGPYPIAVKIADGFCLFAVAVVLSISVSTLLADTWAKVWAIGSAIFADGAFLLTMWSVFSTTENWLSTALHACLFGNCVFWSLNFETAAETCSASIISWACSGAMRYVFYVILIASGFLQFLYWHIVFDPHASNAGSGQLPCCGSRRNNAGGNQYGGGNGGGVQGGGYDDGSFNEMGRRRHLHKSRRLADEEAGLSSSASDAGGAPAPSYKSLGRSDEPAHTASNIPHLPEGGHRPRVVPTGNVDPYADTGESGPTAPAAESNKPAHKDPAEREEIVMIQPGGESNPAGDSEHHTSMHVPHGSKEQEEEEEKLKCMMAK